MIAEKKKIWKIVVVCAFFLVLAGYVETSEGRLDGEGKIVRGDPGEENFPVELKLDAENILEDYLYVMEVPAAKVTREEAVRRFTQAKQEIDETFFAQGDLADSVTHDVHLQESYADDLVQAEWSFESYRAIDPDGHITENAAEEGTLVQADVKLSCGSYIEWYSFSFMVYPQHQTAQEAFLKSVEKALVLEQEREGQMYLRLPQEVDGYRLDWEETREYLVLKVFFLEVAVLILRHFTALERARERERKRREEMMLDYAEVVNKLLVLLASGMSLKQAWNRISARYSEKREKTEIPARQIYEEMLIASHEMQDGESERSAYRKFGERTGLSAYHRLVRILIQNLQTGSRGLCTILEQEAVFALEERKALAKKLGEEAGTKMLLPLTLMLGIVIAIIMVPAMLSFKL